MESSILDEHHVPGPAKIRLLILPTIQYYAKCSYRSHNQLPDVTETERQRNQTRDADNFIPTNLVHAYLHKSVTVQQHTLQHILHTKNMTCNHPAHSIQILCAHLAINLKE
jgi:hypothetical protein